MKRPYINARKLAWIAVIALIGVFVLSFGNAFYNLERATFKFLSPNNVRGMAVEHQEKLYTLNFEQQNALLDAFNRAAPKEGILSSLQKSPVRKVFVYSFNGPDMQIDLLGFSSSDVKSLTLAFLNPVWSSETLYSEVSSMFPIMLSNTFDP